MINLKMSSNSNQDLDPIISASDLHPLYQSASQDGSLDLKEQFNQIILGLRSEAEGYCSRFDEAFNQYVSSNSNLSKMANTLNPQRKERSKKVSLVEGDYNNKENRDVQQLILVMKEGHALLLKIRSQLTGQTIATKFIVQLDGKFYEIEENSIVLNYMLSQYGGGTISNPFSLAYQIDAEMLKTQQLLNRNTEISDSDIWQKISEIKPGYLELKKQYWNSTTGQTREYKNIYYDSKDAEIYERYRSQRGKGLSDLTPQKYFDLRAEIGKSHTPFYKLGDVGLTQMKFVNLDKAKNATINFARLSLIRDRLRQLVQILSESPDIMKDKLINFFTEQESAVTDTTSTIMNNAAKDMIKKLFQNLT